MTCMDPDYERRLLLRQHGVSPLSSPVSPVSTGTCLPFGCIILTFWLHSHHDMYMYCQNDTTTMDLIWVNLQLFQ